MDMGLPTCLVTFPARIQEGLAEGCGCMIFPGIVPEDYIVLMQKEKKRKEKKKASLHLSSELFYFLGLILLFIEHFEFCLISSTPISRRTWANLGSDSAKSAVLRIIQHILKLHSYTWGRSHHLKLESVGFIQFFNWSFQSGSMHLLNLGNYICILSLLC